MNLIKRISANPLESRLEFVAYLTASLVFGFVAIGTFYISISGLYSGVSLVPSLGLFIFGLIFSSLAFSSKSLLIPLFSKTQPKVMPRNQW